MNKILSLAIAGLLLAAALAGCTALPMQPTSGMQSMESMATEAPLPEPEPGKLTIVDVRARPAPLAGGTGAVYFTVLNGLEEEVQLVSAASSAAETVETHETVDDNGVMRMIPLPDGYPVPAGDALVLKPGGKHIMLIGVVEPLAPGDALSLTVNFGNGEAIDLTVPVLDMQMNMSMQDMAGAMEGHDMEAAEGGMEESADHDHADHDHADHDHGDHAEHADLMLPPAVKEAIMALPIGDIHSIDEAINEGGMFDPAAATATLDALMEQLSTGDWPEEVHGMVDELSAKATELRTAIEEGDLAAAGVLAAELHDLIHGLEMHAAE